MRLLGFLIPILAVSGCDQTLVKSVPVEVRVPVVVHCVKSVPDKPVSEWDRTSEKATMVQKVKALLIDREQARGYISELEAVIKGCE